MFKQTKIYFTFLVFVLLGNIAFAKVQIFACETEWRALSQELGGNKVNIYTATTNLQDPHHIQARPSLIAKASRADLLVCTGAELEVGWLPLLLRKSNNGKIQPATLGYFMASSYVSLYEKPTTLDRSEGDIHSQGNPHISLDPNFILQVAFKLSETLIKIDPSNKQYYQKRLSIFETKWKNSINKWEQKASSMNNKTIIVHHNNWAYLNKWLGLKQIAMLEPKSGVAPTSSHLKSLINVAKREKADVIMYTYYQNAKASKWLSQKTSIPTMRLETSPNADETIFQWFDRFINKLIK